MAFRIVLSTAWRLTRESPMPFELVRPTGISCARAVKLPPDLEERPRLQPIRLDYQFATRHTLARQRRNGPRTNAQSTASPPCASPPSRGAREVRGQRPAAVTDGPIRLPCLRASRSRRGGSNAGSYQQA